MGSGRNIGTYDVGGGSVGKSERGKAEHVACAFNLAQLIRLKKRGNTKKFDIWKFQDLFTIVVQSDCTREVVLKRSFIVYTLEKHCDQFFIRTHFCKNSGGFQKIYRQNPSVFLAKILAKFKFSKKQILLILIS